MNELDERLHDLRTQLRTAVVPGTPPARRAPARVPARRVVAVAAVAVLVVAGAVALAQRHRGTTTPGYQGPATTVVGDLAPDRPPNASYLVPSEGMAPTLPMGRVVLVHTPVEEPHVEDIVIHLSLDERLVAKRIVAGPGDTIEAINGRVLRNGVVVDESAYAVGETSDFGPVTIPADNWFVLGDNRPNSQDSRAYGTVQTSALRGVVLAVLREGAIDDRYPLMKQPDTGPTDPDAAATTADVPAPVGACEVSKSAVATASEAYYAKVGTYPPDLRTLQTAGFVSDFGGELAADGLSFTVADAGTGGFTIRYERAADGNSYTITSSDPSSC